MCEPSENDAYLYFLLSIPDQKIDAAPGKPHLTFTFSIDMGGSLDITWMKWEREHVEELEVV